MSTKTKSLNEIISPVQTYVEKLNDRLINSISADSRSLSIILSDIFQSGGKRLRPIISFLSYELLKSEANIQNYDEEKIFLIAEISELIHTASLVHDDIIDNSMIRRGSETTNKKWNNAVAVISGDFMFARAAVNLGKLEDCKVVSIYAAVLADLCDGEIRQVENKFSTKVDWDYYFLKTFKKTASLFEASAKSVVVSISKNKKQENALSLYAKNLGLAFQIIDDILDYKSDTKTLGKPVLSDLAEGQVTIPVLYALQDLDTASKQELVSLIESLQNKSSAEQEITQAESSSNSDEILKLINSAKGLEKSFEKASELISEAKNALNIFSDCTAKQALSDLADFVIDREL